MDIETTRFGTVTVSDDRIITFPKGILGFPSCKQFCLLQPADDSVFFWLQSVEDPSLAFVVTDPVSFVADYSVPIREDQMMELKLSAIEDAQVFVIVNKVEGSLTGNLQGPLVINTLGRVAEQMVLAEKRWTTREKLLTLPAQRSAQTA
jgi:flagellar assembly factor FliW